MMMSSSAQEQYNPVDSLSNHTVKSGRAGKDPDKIAFQEPKKQSHQNHDMKTSTEIPAQTVLQTILWPRLFIYRVNQLVKK